MADPATMMAIGTGVQGVQGLAAGQQGKRAGQQLDQQMRSQTERLEGLLGTGQGMLDTAMGMNPSFGGQREALMNQAITGGQQFSGNLQNLVGDLMGVGDAGAGAIGQQLAGLAGPSFDFAPGSNMMDQAMAGFGTMAENLRNQAGDAAAQQFTAGGGALDAALASRGIGRGSGVAAGATRDMAVQGAQGLAGIERDLATMGTQMGLEATQFDVGRRLQEQGMQSNFALGSAAQQAQNLLGGGQLALGSAAQRAGNIGQAGSMLGQAFTTPLAMQQGMFTDNFMNPMLQQQGMLGGLAANLMGQGLGGMSDMMGMRNQQVQSAGAGKGSALGGVTNPANAGAFSNKQS